MPSVDDKSLDATVTSETTFQPPLHSGSYSGMPLHVYPIPSQFLQPQQPVRSKRRQVKNACTHCQKACKKCDDARPCLRCVKYGISEECVDSQRKERKKGIKRGPYKKRDGKCMSICLSMACICSNHSLRSRRQRCCSFRCATTWRAYPRWHWTPSAIYAYARVSPRLLWSLPTFGLKARRWPICLYNTSILLDTSPSFYATRSTRE